MEPRSFIRRDISEGRKMTLGESKRIILILCDDLDDLEAAIEDGVGPDMFQEVWEKAQSRSIKRPQPKIPRKSRKKV